MTTVRRRSFALLAATAAATTLTACAADAVDAQAPAVTSDATAAPPAGDDDATTPAADGTVPDGSYTATGGYRSPAGEEEITVALTVADGVVSAVEVTPGATDPTSLSYQTRFASGIAEQVVGKALADVDVDRVSGSSLTSGGFMAALEEIASGATG